MRALQVNSMRSQISNFKCGVMTEALFNGTAPLLDVLRRRVGIHASETHSSLPQHRLTKIKLASKQRRGRSEVVALLSFRKHVRNIVALVAPGIHIHRRKENSEGGMKDQSEIRQRLRESEPRSNVVSVGIFKSLGIAVLASNKH